MKNSEWFKVEPIDTHTWAISENSHWEQPRSYLLTGSERALLIDSGTGIGSIRQIVSGLTRLPVLVTSTHVHWDHIGGHDEFSDIAVFEEEVPWLTGHFPLTLAAVKHELLKEPFVPPEGFDIDTYQLPCCDKQTLQMFSDNACIELGGWQIRVIHTPGHSPGHVCFYEEERGYLFTGDLIYRGKLDVYYPSTNPQDFSRSVRKIAKLPVSCVFPGHFDTCLPSGIIQDVLSAVNQLELKGLLSQGSGQHIFEQFTIHF
ncbi:MBL fold metallo-hydrolase [Vagococcus acidifermentans]|uniref:Metallo-beta-lactamase domain-containing protein n=1 Tax=Vagococcus acidifermentans TaxID=564710 RepID=A0A430AZ46_9ENTE|nr:MBL fold metallo-hydrolase [Vagococcus acidifermentans]RSU13342.1 hypothetical protein CBF27_03955 [Vagococcus acidifermentans]